MSTVEKLRTFVKQNSGAAMLEYTVLLAIILVAAITAIIFAGDWAAGVWTNLQTTLGANNLT